MCTYDTVSKMFTDRWDSTIVWLIILLFYQSREFRLVALGKQYVCWAHVYSLKWIKKKKKRQQLKKICVACCAVHLHLIIYSSARRWRSRLIFNQIAASPENMNPLPVYLHRIKKPIKENLVRVCVRCVRCVCVFVIKLLFKLNWVNRIVCVTIMLYDVFQYPDAAHKFDRKRLCNS